MKYFPLFCTNKVIREPEFIEMGMDIRVNLYRDVNGVNGSQNGVNETKFDTIHDTNDTDSEKIIALMKANPEITQKKLQEDTMLSLSTVKRIVADLQGEGKVAREGNNRTGKWIVTE